MASTRSTQHARRRQPTDRPKDAFAALAGRAARVQIAGSAAVVTSLVGWASSADRLTQAVGDELLRRVDGETDSAELLAAVTRAASAHLRELSALPRTATEHFEARLARLSNDT